ncbi:MAG: hypothetical protein ACI4KM_08365 [Oscillospiraceae bacterium]
MTLLLTVIAAIVVTIVWYTSEKARKLNVSLLCFMYWGASLMWLVDAVVEYLELGAEYFLPAGEEMLNDGFLGLSVVILGGIIWLVFTIVKDPNGVVKNALLRKR